MTITTSKATGSRYLTIMIVVTVCVFDYSCNRLLRKSSWSWAIPASFLHTSNFVVENLPDDNFELVSERRGSSLTVVLIAEVSSPAIAQAVQCSARSRRCNGVTQLSAVSWRRYSNVGQQELRCGFSNRLEWRSVIVLANKILKLYLVNCAITRNLSSSNVTR